MRNPDIHDRRHRYGEDVQFILSRNNYLLKSLRGEKEEDRRTLVLKNERFDRDLQIISFFLLSLYYILWFFSLSDSPSPFIHLLGLHPSLLSLFS